MYKRKIFINKLPLLSFETILTKNYKKFQIIANFFRAHACSPLAIEINAFVAIKRQLLCSLHNSTMPWYRVKFYFNFVQILLEFVSFSENILNFYRENRTPLFEIKERNTEKLHT